MGTLSTCEEAVLGRGLPLLQGPLLGSEVGVAHGFTTRHGGVSGGALQSLNLARRPAEDDAVLTENWRRVLEALHPSLRLEDLALLQQVHGARVVRVGEPGGPLQPVAEADAAVTTEPGLVLAVRVADCVPVLLAGDGGVAVAHAGWRGTAAGVVPATVEALCAATGAPASGLRAAIGPHIGPGAYEVGDEVVEGLTTGGVPPAVFLREGKGPRPHVDLGAAVAWQLAQKGVQRVDRVGGCTYTDPALFSHRGDPSTGRLAGVIARLA